MAAVEDFNRPAWANPIDEDLDWMRDTQNFLLTLAAAGSSVAPGWLTQIDTSENNNNAQPDQVILYKYSATAQRNARPRVIRIKTTWV